MIESDTVKLLRECDAGAKMGVQSIDEVTNHVRNEQFRGLLDECRRQHVKLSGEINEELERFRDEGKDPFPLAKGMSWLKTNVMLGMKDTDSTVADLMTDGCNMGVKSLNRYLNQYRAADEKSKDIAKKLISLEAQLCTEMRKFL